jgi:hypothetical protein
MTADSPRGVFSLPKSGTATPAKIWARPDVAGVAVRTEWAAVEPSAGKYSWAYLDGEAAAAHKYGKSVILSVKAGKGCPAWLYKKGCRYVAFADEGESVRCPVPWDPVFLDRWRSFVGRLGTRYGNARVLAAVKVCGVNRASAETSLPHDQTSWARWLQLGYTDERLLAAWAQIADAYATAFPSPLRLAVPYIPDGLPSVEKGGRLSDRLLDLAVARFPGRLTPMSHALSAGWDAPKVRELAAAGHPTGYQMLWSVSNDGGDRMDDGQGGGPAAVLTRAVDRGVAAGGDFLEVYQADVANHPAVVRHAAAALA